MLCAFCGKVSISSESKQAHKFISSSTGFLSRFGRQLPLRLSYLRLNSILIAFNLFVPRRAPATTSRTYQSGWQKCWNGFEEGDGACVRSLQKIDAEKHESQQ